VGWLLQVSHTLPPADLAAAIGEALEASGAARSRIFLVDHDQRRLHPFGPDGEAEGSLEVDATTGGRAYTLERLVTVPTDGGARLWLPLIDGTARFGVVAVDLPDAEPDEASVQAIECVVSLAAELLMTKGNYTDVVEHVRRHRPMSLEAELQRANLPPTALITPQVAVAAILLPAYEVAGDSFDYALNEDRLEVAIIDSVGHELVSSLVSHLVQGSLRNSRRRGLDLPEAYRAADAAVARAFPDMRFATAAFGHLELASGRFRWVSAGHPLPLLVRQGNIAGEAHAVPALPIGLGGTPQVNEVVLGPGDALLLYTDGVTEGGVRGGGRFGLDRLVDLFGRVLLAGLPPAEVVRRLVGAVLEHSAYELHDDTTVVLIQRRDGT
jgi:phosphoserine phosphatase RsbU/P